MALISTQDLITLVLKILEEPSGLPDANGNTRLPHWSRDEVLQRMNMQQSKISTELPGLFNHVDTSLTTTGVNGGYPIPSNMGNIRDVEVGGNPCVWTSRDELLAMSLRGDIEQNWEQTAGNISPLFTFYCWIELDDSSGTLQPTLYFYPYVVNAGQTIKITGELLLSSASDSSTAYAFQSVPYLEKAQELLVKLTAQWFAMDEKPGLYDKINTEIFGHTGSTNDRGLMGKMQSQYLVLRTSPKPPMITIKNSEDVPNTEFKWTRTTLPG